MRSPRRANIWTISKPNPFTQNVDIDLFRSFLGSANMYGKIMSSETGAIWYNTAPSNYTRPLDDWVQLCYLQFRKNSGFTLVKDNKHGPALGILDGAVYRETEWNLEKGDGIFVYTDGVPEATDAHEEMFGNQRMVAALNKYMNRNSEGLLRGVRSEVDQFVGDAPQFDDLTMLAVRYYGKET